MTPSRPGQPNPSRPARGGTPREGAPTILSTAPNVLSLLRALRHRWPVALVLGLVLGGLAAAAVWFLLPTPKATARTTVQVSQRSFVSGEPVKDPVNYQKTQVALVKSRLVLNAALRDPGVAKLPLVKGQVEPVEWLEKEVQADFSLAPEVLRIWMEGHDPAQLVPIVNAVREAYRKEVVDKESSARRARLDWLAQQREGFEAKLREAGELRRAAERGAGGKDAVLRARILSFMQEYVALTERQLLKTKDDLRDAKGELALLEPAEKDPADLKIPEADVEKALAQDKTVQALEAQEAELQGTLVGTLERSRKKDRDDDVQRLRRQVAAARARIKAYKAALRKSILGKLREEARTNLAGKLAALRGKITHLKGAEAMLEKEVGSLRKDLAAKTERGIRLDEIQENLGRVEEWAKRLGNEEQKVKLEIQAPSGVSVLEEGVVNRVNAEQRQAVMVGVAALTGLGLALFGVSWLEHRARRVDAAEEVAEGLGMRLVGTLPDTARVSRRLASGKDPVAHNLLTESVDSCRVMLLHMAREEGLRVVMVTSAVSGEGKTSLVSHLAASMARAGLRTLLVDADLRNPSAHRVFNLSNEGGFSEVLRGEADVSRATQPTPLPGLSVLSAGRWDTRTIQALAQGGAGPILTGLRQQYDFVLVDSSPVLPVADALLVGPHTDGVLLSVLRHVSRMPNLYTAAQRIESLGQRVLGAVVNGVRGQGDYASYPYYLSPPRPKGEPAEAGPEGQPG